MPVQTLLILLVACNRKPSGDVVDLTIVPGDISLTTTAEEAAEQSFSVTATYENGAEQENFPLMTGAFPLAAVLAARQHGNLQ